jgi:hypothetical protein
MLSLTFEGGGSSRRMVSPGAARRSISPAAILAQVRSVGPFGQGGIFGDGSGQLQREVLNARGRSLGRHGDEVQEDPIVFLQGDLPAVGLRPRAPVQSVQAALPGVLELDPVSARRTELLMSQIKRGGSGPSKVAIVKPAETPVPPQEDPSEGGSVPRTRMPIAAPRSGGGSSALMASPPVMARARRTAAAKDRRRTIVRKAISAAGGTRLRPDGVASSSS